MRAILLLCIGIALGLGGCATPARIDQMVIGAQTMPTTPPPESLRQNIAVKDVTGGQDTNPMWTSQVSSSDFERALEVSLRAVNLLQANRQGGRFYITAQLGKLEQPLLGVSMTVTATVTYTLVERASGRTVWEKTITTPYTAAFSDAFVGTERLKLANEGAARANISELVNQLYRFAG